MGDKCALYEWTFTYGLAIGISTMDDGSFLYTDCLKKIGTPYFAKANAFYIFCLKIMINPFFFITI